MDKGMYRRIMAQEKLEPGVNGHILPVSENDLSGWVFQATDGTRGPFHPDTPQGNQDGWLRAYAAAQRDWREYVDSHPTPVGQRLSRPPTEPNT